MDAALIYARRGWAVFPCHSPVPGRSCSCGRANCSSPAKHPRVAGGLKAATTDPWQIRSWWERWPAANVAIRTGAISGLVVVDVDPPHGGDRSLAQLEENHRGLPRQRLVLTGSGGQHIYLAHPGENVRNDAGRRLGGGIDIRGDGGYVIAPPSRHESGGRYRWTARDGLPAVPGWLAELLRPCERRVEAWDAVARVRDAGAWAGAAVEAEVQTLRTAVEGSRNATLNRAAFSLGQLVGGGALNESVVIGALFEAALKRGLGEGEARRTIQSGIVAGMASPRVVPPDSFAPRLTTEIRHEAGTRERSEPEPSGPYAANR